MIFPGKDRALFEACSSGACNRLKVPDRVSLASASIALVKAAGLATTVEPAVTVGAVVDRLARLVTLAGLVSGFSSYGTGLGIDIAFAAVVMPSLIVVVATGASWGLLIPVPPPAIREDKALCPGFSLIAGAFSC